MLDKLILIIISVLSYMVFSNAISKEKIMKSYVNSIVKTMLSIGISITLFLMLDFIAESLIGSDSQLGVVIDGVFIGWTVALSSRLQKSSRATTKKSS